MARWLPADYPMFVTDVNQATVRRIQIELFQSRDKSIAWALWTGTLGNCLINRLHSENRTCFVRFCYFKQSLVSHKYVIPADTSRFHGPAVAATNPKCKETFSTERGNLLGFGFKYLSVHPPEPCPEFIIKIKIRKPSKRQISWTQPGLDLGSWQFAARKLCNMLLRQCQRAREITAQNEQREKSADFHREEEGKLNRVGIAKKPEQKQQKQPEKWDQKMAKPKGPTRIGNSWVLNHKGIEVFNTLTKGLQINRLISS